MADRLELAIITTSEGPPGRPEAAPPAPPGSRPAPPPPVDRPYARQAGKDRTPEQEARERLARQDRDREIKAEMERLRPTPQKQGLEAFQEKLGGVTSQLGPLAGGLGGVASAAGPLGIGIAAAQLQFRAVAGAATGVREAFEKVGEIGRELISNNPLKAYDRYVQGVEKLADSLPLVGGVVSAGLQLTFAPMREFTATLDALTARAKELARYSPQLAYSEAMAQVRDTLADVREAQDLGDSLSRLRDAQSELSVLARENLLPLKTWVIENLAGFLEQIVGVLRDGQFTVSVIKNVLEVLPEALGKVLKLDAEGAGRVIGQAVSRAIRDEVKVKDAEPLDVLDRVIGELARAAFDPPVPANPGEVIGLGRPQIPQEGF